MLLCVSMASSRDRVLLQFTWNCEQRYFSGGKTQSERRKGPGTIDRVWRKTGCKFYPDRMFFFFLRKFFLISKNFLNFLIYFSFKILNKNSLFRTKILFKNRLRRAETSKSICFLPFWEISLFFCIFPKISLFFWSEKSKEKKHTRPLGRFSNKSAQGSRIWCHVSPFAKFLLRANPKIEKLRRSGDLGIFYQLDTLHHIRKNVGQWVCMGQKNPMHLLQTIPAVTILTEIQLLCAHCTSLTVGPAPRVHLVIK